MILSQRWVCAFFLCVLLVASRALERMAHIRGPAKGSIREIVLFGVGREAFGGVGHDGGRDVSPGTERV